MAGSVLHFNDGKSGHAGIFSQMGLDVGIHSHIYYLANDIRGICASAKKSTEKQKRLNNLKGTKKGPRGQLQISEVVCL